MPPQGEKGRPQGMRLSAAKSSKIEHLAKPGERSLKAGAQCSENGAPCRQNGAKCSQNGSKIVPKRSHYAPTSFPRHGFPHPWVGGGVGGGKGTYNYNSIRKFAILFKYVLYFPLICFHMFRLICLLYTLDHTLTQSFFQQRTE